MRFIELKSLPNGAHRNQDGGAQPSGWAIIPEGMEIPNTFPFVDVNAENGIVTKMTPGIVPPAPEPEPMEAEDAAALLVDHEYRLTLLELGVTDIV